MKVLVLGTSHVNSLKLAQKYATKQFASSVAYSWSSIETWLASDVLLQDGAVVFKGAMEDIFSHAMPLPRAVQQLNKDARLSDFDMIVVVQVGTTGNDNFYERYAFPGSLNARGRIPISFDILDELINPVNGHFNHERKVSWASDAPTMVSKLSARGVLQLIGENSGGAKLVFVCAHPMFYDEKFDDSFIEKYNLSRCDYYHHWARLCSQLGFSFIEPPVAAMVEDTYLTELSWSRDPSARDTHLNEAYGELLWHEIQKLVL